MSIVMQYNKESNVTYVYSSESYYDEAKKQSRSKRKLIGKLDPATGKIIPTEGRGRKAKNPVNTAAAADVAAKDEIIRLNEQITALRQEKTELAAEIASLRQQNGKLVSQNQRLTAAVHRISSICAPIEEA